MRCSAAPGSRVSSLTSLRFPSCLHISREPFLVKSRFSPQGLGQILRFDFKIITSQIDCTAVAWLSDVDVLGYREKERHIMLSQKQVAAQASFFPPGNARYTMSCFCQNSGEVAEVGNPRRRIGRMNSREANAMTWNCNDSRRRVSLRWAVRAVVVVGGGLHTTLLELQSVLILSLLLL